MKNEGTFKTSATSAALSVHHLNRAASGIDHSTNGDDAFVDFGLSNPISPASAHLLNINLSCSDGAASAPIQIFWLADGMASYDELHSARVPYRTGKYLLDLRTVPKWAEAASVSRVRVDIDPDQSRHQFRMSNPVFGVKGT